MRINATAYDISILSMDGVDFKSSSKSYLSASDYITVVRKIPSSFTCEVEVFEISQEPICGIPAKKVRYGKITNLPDPQEGVFYIVDNLVAFVAKARGRNNLVLMA